MPSVPCFMTHYDDCNIVNRIGYYFALEFTVAGNFIKFLLFPGVVV